MPKSLDELIEFLIERIALHGEEGLNIDELQHAIEAFYESDQSTSSATVAPPQIDDRYTLKVWTWLLRNPDITSGKRRLVEGTSQKATSKPPANAAAYGSPTTSSANLQPPPLKLPDKKVILLASEERMWQTLTGHSVDHKLVAPMQFTLLSIISTAGEEGIPQPALVKQSGQDKRSVPQRTDGLAQKGYIEKRPFKMKGMNTSLCTLRRFVKEEDIVPPKILDSKTATPKQLFKHIFPPSHPPKIDNLLDVLLDLMKDTPEMKVAELRKLLGTYAHRQETRITYVTFYRLELLGVLQRIGVMSATGLSTTLNAVKLLKIPDRVTRERFLNWTVADEDDLLKNGDEFRQRTTEMSDPEAEDGETGAEETSMGQDNDDLRPMTQWTPEKPLINVVYDLVNAAGVRGMNTMDFQNYGMGPFWKRSVYEVLSHLTDIWQVSQPPHLRHLAIIRDTQIIDKNVYYLYRTYENHEKAVEAGLTSWEAVTSDTNLPTTMSRRAPTTKDQPLDQFGFPSIPRHSLFKAGLVSATETRAKYAKFVPVEHSFLNDHLNKTTTYHHGAASQSEASEPDDEPEGNEYADETVVDMPKQVLRQPMEKPMRKYVRRNDKPLGRPRKYPKEAEVDPREKDPDVKAFRASTRKHAIKLAEAELKRAGLVTGLTLLGKPFSTRGRPTKPEAQLKRPRGRPRKDRAVAANIDEQAPSLDGSVQATRPQSVDASVNSSTDAVTAGKRGASGEANGAPDAKRQRLEQEPPAIEQSQIDARIEAIQLELLGLSRPGLYIMPPDVHVPVPEVEFDPFIVVVKSNRLCEKDWFNVTSQNLPRIKRDVGTPRPRKSYKARDRSGTPNSQAKPASNGQIPTEEQAKPTAKRDGPSPRSTPTKRRYNARASRANFTADLLEDGTQTNEACSERPAKRPRRRPARFEALVDADEHQDSVISDAPQEAAPVNLPAHSPDNIHEPPPAARASTPDVMATATPAQGDNVQDLSIFDQLEQWIEAPGIVAGPSHKESAIQSASQSASSKANLPTPHQLLPAATDSENMATPEQSVWSMNVPVPHAHHSAPASKPGNPGSRTDQTPLASQTVTTNVLQSPTNSALEKSQVSQSPHKLTSQYLDHDDDYVPDMPDADADDDADADEEADIDSDPDAEAEDDGFAVIDVTSGNCLPAAPKTGLKRQWRVKGGIKKTGGTVGHRRNQIILKLIAAAGGAFPIDRELWYAYTTETHKTNPDVTSDPKTVKRAVKNLTDYGKLTKITFAFANSDGVQIMKYMVVLPGVKVNSDHVQELQRRMIAAHPHMCFPHGVEINRELVPTAFRHEIAAPKPRMQTWAVRKQSAGRPARPTGRASRVRQPMTLNQPERQATVEPAWKQWARFENVRSEPHIQLASLRAPTPAAKSYDIDTDLDPITESEDEVVAEASDAEPIIDGMDFDVFEDSDDAAFAMAPTAEQTSMQREFKLHGYIFDEQDLPPVLEPGTKLSVKHEDYMSEEQKAVEKAQKIARGKAKEAKELELIDLEKLGTISNDFAKALGMLEDSDDDSDALSSQGTKVRKRRGRPSRRKMGTDRLFAGQDFDGLSDVERAKSPGKLMKELKRKLANQKKAKEKTKQYNYLWPFGKIKGGRHPVIERITTFTDPVQVFHASSGTFSTNFFTVRNTKTRLPPLAHEDKMPRLVRGTTADTPLTGLAALTGSAKPSSSRRPERPKLTIDPFAHRNWENKLLHSLDVLVKQNHARPVDSDFDFQVNQVERWELRNEEDLTGRMSLVQPMFINHTIPQEVAASTPWSQAKSQLNNKFAGFVNTFQSTHETIARIAPDSYQSMLPPPPRPMTQPGPLYTPEEAIRVAPRTQQPWTPSAMAPVRTTQSSYDWPSEDVQMQDTVWQEYNPSPWETAPAWLATTTHFANGNVPAWSIESSPAAPIAWPTAAIGLPMIEPATSTPTRRSPSTLSISKGRPSANGDPATRAAKAAAAAAAGTLKKRGRKATHLTNNDVERLIAAVVAVRALIGGTQQRVSWHIIEQLLPYNDLTSMKDRWNRFESLQPLQVVRLEEQFQEAFIEAYQRGELGILDFTDVEHYDWDNLIVWTTHNLDIPSDDIASDLPRDQGQINGVFDISAIQEPDDPLREEYLREYATQLKRTEVLHEMPYYAPIHSFPTNAEDLQVASARTYVRANNFTPAKDYNANSARKRLEYLFNEADLDAAISMLHKSNIIVPKGKGGRVVPGRNYAIHERVMKDIKRTAFDISLLHNASHHKVLLDNALLDPRGPGRLPISQTAGDGEIALLLNLVAAGKIAFEIDLPPTTKDPNVKTIDPVTGKRHLSVWGFTEGNYKTTQMDRGNVLFNIAAVPTKDYVPSVPLPHPLPPPPAPHLEGSAGQGGKAIPFWYDIHDRLLPELWELVVVQCLTAVVMRPGAGVREIRRMCRSVLEEDDVRQCLEWLKGLGVVGWSGEERSEGVGHDAEYEGGYVAREWWWSVLGSGGLK